MHDFDTVGFVETTMSEHIQECPSSNSCDCSMGPVHKDSCPQRKKCICDELRAYGERLIAEEDRMIPIIRRNEYQRGLDAAWDAVAPLDLTPVLTDGQSAWARSMTLAAIDTLREHYSDLCRCDGCRPT